MSDQVLGGRYRLQRPLGRGATATVWQARDTRLDRPAAVKILDAASRADPAALERLRREARSVARLAHDHIVGVYDVDVTDEAAYLVMELVDGPSVSQMLASRGRLPVERAVSIAAQVCDALGAAHAAGVVHRDVKPSNILVDASSTVKVCDFGVALLDRGAGDPALPGGSDVVGTCQYMAPEQAAGDPVDGRADVYAVGCVLYAMVAGVPPFLADRPMDVLDLHRNASPVPLPVHRGDVPPEVADLVAEMLATHAADRPATAWDARDRLRAIVAGEPVAAPTVLLPAVASRSDDHTAVLPAPPVGRRRRTAVGRATVLSGGAVATAALATALIVAVLAGGGRPTASARPAPGPTASGSAPSLSPSAEPSSGPIDVPSPTRPADAGTSAPVRVAPVDRLAGLAMLLQMEADSGRLRPKAAKGLLRDLERVVRARDAGQTAEAAGRFADFRERVSELSADGELAGVTLPDLNGIAASLRAG